MDLVVLAVHPGEDADPAMAPMSVVLATRVDPVAAAGVAILAARTSNRRIWTKACP